MEGVKKKKEKETEEDNYKMRKGKHLERKRKN